MARYLNIKREVLTLFSQNWLFFTLWGLALLILGSLAIYYTTATTFLTVYIIGILLFISGIVVLIDSFQFWWNKSRSGFILHLLMGLLYIIAGFILIKGPIIGALTITLLLAYFFLIVGILRIIYAFSVRFPQWGWSLFSGILSIILGVLIISGFPGTGLYILGLFVGIDLLVLGWVYLLLGITAKSVGKEL